MDGKNEGITKAEINSKTLSNDPPKTVQQMIEEINDESINKIKLKTLYAFLSFANFKTMILDKKCAVKRTENVTVYSKNKE